MRIRLILAVSLVFSFTGCANLPGTSRHPDEVLFERAQDALQKQKYDVAQLTLRTLVNTYPESEYAKDAEVLLKSYPELVRNNCEEQGTCLNFFPNTQ